MFYFAMLVYQNLKVTEMKAEYFPPKEDVILQNEAPTEFYIFVTGAAVRYCITFFFFFSLLCYNLFYCIPHTHTS